ncbi:hypothetical protein [Methylovulum psychrotolerans]|uniref:Uncharacterized protein n=1 Tax=Methylovulum psychrotolerans TaxID=1704499 RepID=A0A1Z4C4Q6_9GAMM|nr:hypothetical protein [Methylovulum psychrotolerans]ASF48522.1 hypothetical protein CEK71_22060 [Methylovulum psychrotolerans]
MNTIIRWSLAATLNGCGLSQITNRESNPVIKDYVGNPISHWFSDDDVLNTFATTASRRMVMIRDYQTTDGTNKARAAFTCAEPSPDVGEAFSSALADGIKIAVPVEGVSAEVSNQYARAVATQITPLLYRTQGLQLYRNAIYSLCIDKMNEALATTTVNNNARNAPSDSDYEAQRKYIFDQSVELITDVTQPLVFATLHKPFGWP